MDTNTKIIEDNRQNKARVGHILWETAKVERACVYELRDVRFTQKIDARKRDFRK